MTEKAKSIRQLQTKLFKEDNFYGETAAIAMTKNNLGKQEAMVLSGYPLMTDKAVQLFCETGRGKLLINTVLYDICAGVYICITPNAVFQVIEYTPDISMKLIIFSYDYIADIPLNRDVTIIIQNIAQYPVVQLSDMDSQEFTRFYTQMLQQFISVDLYREEIIKSMFSIIIYKITGYYFQQITKEENRKISRNETIYKEFLKLLFKYYKTQRSVSFYAEKLNLTQKYLSKVITIQSEKPPLHWIQEMVLQYAKAQLKSSNLTVAQISEELQFPNPSFFGTYFKKLTSVTPVQYRKGDLKGDLVSDK